MKEELNFNFSKKSYKRD